MRQNNDMNAAEIITELGGIRPAARLLGLQASAVSNWKIRGKIPAKWLAVIREKTGIEPEGRSEQ